MARILGQPVRAANRTVSRTLLRLPPHCARAPRPRGLGNTEPDTEEEPQMFADSTLRRPPLPFPAQAAGLLRPSPSGPTSRHTAADAGGRSGAVEGRRRRPRGTAARRALAADRPARPVRPVDGSAWGACPRGVRPTATHDTAGGEKAPGRALRRRTGLTGWNPDRRLGPGGTAAPERESLALLPSGPDAVRTLPVRGTRPVNTTCLDPCPTKPPSDGVRSRWSGFRVQGTADSPPSATGQRDGSKGPSAQGHFSLREKCQRLAQLRFSNAWTDVAR